MQFVDPNDRRLQLVRHSAEDAIAEAVRLRAIASSHRDLMQSMRAQLILDQKALQDGFDAIRRIRRQHGL